MTVDRVRVISLDRTPERYAEFLRLNPGLPVERVAAVDGRTLDRERCVAEGLIAPANPYASGSLGSMVSHVSLWRRALAEGRPVHVAEDDALFRRDFVSAASACLDGLGTWDVVLWGWNFDWPLKVRLAPGLGTAVLQGNQPELGTEWRSFFEVSTPPAMVQLLSAAGICGYSISPGGARRLIDLSLPVAGWPAHYAPKPGVSWTNNSIDVEMSRHYAGLSAHVAIPPLVASLNDKTASTVALP